ncbi:DUF4349 domain-containing protein [Pseudonocardia sp. TRM90224]|uniref:DUF4349 domain-containing protein n=1 Tax=Pseudonocardia sp. TRM90224 TaxID=2812678 RepID=UPI001E2F57B0|nr:DUF4349 domain-containing protein [Pseudonocardia sp. TRM90224]
MCATAMALGACGASNSGGGDSSAPSPAVARDGDSLSSPSELAGSAPAAPPAGTAGSPQKAPAPSPDQPITPVGRSLIRTAQLAVEVDDVTIAHSQVRTAVVAAGGYIAEEQTYRTNASMVLRVPAATLDKVTDDVSALGTPTSRSTQVSDVTEQVVDLGARVATQQASVARVRTLLAQATTIGDVVSIESELARREADLDSLTGRLAALQGQVELSTLTVDLRQKDGAKPDAEEPGPTGFLAGIDAGWRGLMALGTIIGAVAGFVLPFLPVLLVIGAIVWYLRRTIKARPAPTPALAGAGAAPSGSAPSGSAPSGSAPGGAAPSGAAPSGPGPDGAP